VRPALRVGEDDTDRRTLEDRAELRFLLQQLFEPAALASGLPSLKSSSN
jgi:hypothetical protein